MTKDLGDKTGSHASHEAAEGASSPSVSIPIAEIRADHFINDFILWLAEWREEVSADLAESHAMDANCYGAGFDGGRLDAIDIMLGNLRETLERGSLEPAQGIEAGTAETQRGSVHESPVPEGNAP